jgi:hypothetical protein
MCQAWPTRCWGTLQTWKQQMAMLVISGDGGASGAGLVVRRRSQVAGSQERQEQQLQVMTDEAYAGVHVSVFF